MSGISFVFHSLLVTNSGYFSPIPSLTENILGRRHWSCYSNCIHIYHRYVSKSCLFFGVIKLSQSSNQTFLIWGASLHLTECLTALQWGYPKPDRHIVHWGQEKRIRLFSRVVERPEANLTELIVNSLRPAGYKSGNIFLLSLSFLMLNWVWTLRETQGGEGSYAILFGPFSRSMWMVQGSSELGRPRLKKASHVMKVSSATT